MDMNSEMMLDGNAVGGLLLDLFGAEMTASPTECAGCGTEHEVAQLWVFMQAPGVVLRCPSCKQVMMRIVKTPGAYYLDARGAVYLRIAR